MKREFFAEFDLVGKIDNDGFRNKNLIDSLTGKTSEGLPRGWENLDEFSRLQVLFQTIVLGKDKKVEWRDKRGKIKNIDVKSYSRSGAIHYEKPGGLLWWYYGENLNLKEPKGNFQEFLSKRLRWMAQILGFEELQNTISQIIISPPLPDLSIFPHGSWAVRVPFTLRKPYISKDDKAFYILDNPVKKEWVFKVPYVAPSQWKGTLRATMVRQLVDWWQKQNNQNPEEFARNRLRLFLLFGDEKGEEPGSIKGLAKYLDDVGGAEAAKIFREKVHKLLRMSEDKPLPHFSGRLHFYPTFFDRIGMEVINPQDRRKGTGARGPIYFECVPAGTGGIFALLYVPLIQEDDKAYKDDIKSIARGIRSMLTTYGFGAKTSSGYGVADVDKSGIIVEPEGWKDEFIKGWDENG